MNTGNKKGGQTNMFDHKHGIALRMIVLAFSFLFCGAGSVHADGIADSFPTGKWYGTACYCGYVLHNEFKFSRTDGKLNTQGYYAIAMSGREIRSAVSEKLKKEDAQPFAMLVFQNYEVQATGGSVLLRGCKGRVVFTGSENSRKWIPDIYEGKLIEPGLLVGTIKVPEVHAVTNKLKDGVFYFYKDDRLLQPPELMIEKGKAHQLTCLDGVKYHYSCYVPK